MQELLATADITSAPALVALAVVLLASIFIGRVVSNTFHGKYPPVLEGIPFIGGLRKFIKGPWSLMKEGYEKCGEVFTVPVAHKRITFLIGPEVAPHFFNAPDDKMSQSEVYDYSVPTFGKGVVYDVDQKVRTEQFRWFTEALKKDRLKRYVPQFVMEAENYFSKWGDSGIVDLGEEFSKLVTLTAARTLLGREVREQMFEKVSGLLHMLDEGMVPISVLFPYLPIAVHKKRDQARDELKAIFAKIIQARRASGIVEEDVLQQFIDAKYVNVFGGRPTTEDECTGLLIAALFAGQHTSSITSAWTGYFMIHDKDKSFKAAQEEQKRIVGEFGSEISFDALQSMDVLHRSIQEALRIHPPLIMLLRCCKESFAVTTSSGKQVVIPKGDIVATSPSFSHMLARVFKDPEAYQPERFAPPREEDKAKPFTYLGFGGGRHGCLGQQFAYLQIKAIWSVVLRNFDFEPLDPLPEADYESMVIGPKKSRVRFTRKRLA